mmetsp:Transcript_64144/g.106621  ORF Transcript_64144/g.106621 Transcript_64144/m.106621 type:complete len:213 (+) Transcript_64144:2404-3042(+)
MTTSNVSSLTTCVDLALAIDGRSVWSSTFAGGGSSSGVDSGTAKAFNCSVAASCMPVLLDRRRVETRVGGGTTLAAIAVRKSSLVVSSKSGRDMSSICFSILRCAFSAAASSTFRTASAISRATRSSASFLAFSMAAAICASCSFCFFFASSAFSLASSACCCLRICSSASLRARSSASLRARSSASFFNRACRSRDHLAYSRRAFIVRTAC